ncbi:MAG: DUF3078 domain-containing protein [Bacteroidota bacterium]
MNKAFCLVLAFFLGASFNSRIHAQAIVIPDTLSGWQGSWVANLNGSQSTFDNWSQGGVTSISGTASSVYKQVYRKGNFGYGFRATLRYGQANIQDQGVRKTDDFIGIRNRFTYAFTEDGKLSGFASFVLETQFDDGFIYEGAISGADSLISGFFAPAYFTESAGLAYTPSNNLTLEAGLALKQTLVTEEALRPVYDLALDDNLRAEGGLTLGASFAKEVATNITYSGSVETFSNLLRGLDRTDVIWTNELVGQINKIVSATFQFELRYDDDFNEEIQLKQVLSAGISVNLY